MKRSFFTVGAKRCPYACTYCFTEFKNYIRPTSIYSLLNDDMLIDDVDIIYPACDIEFFCLRNWKDILKGIIKYNKIIVISTKTLLSDKDVLFLKEMYLQLYKNGGFLKIGISITTKFKVKDIEPKAPNYEERLEMANKLSSAGIPICLILKPLLVDVASTELREIISDFHAICNIVLIGPEYLDIDSPREVTTNQLVHAKIQKKNVNWKEGNDKWSFRGSSCQMNDILEITKEFSIPVAYNDIEVIHFLKTKFGVML